MKEMPADSEVGSEAIANPYLSVISALVFPGLGHFLLGRRVRALAFALIVLTSLVVGLQLQGRIYAATPSQPLAFLATLAEMAMGIPYFVLRFVVGYQGDVSGIGFEYGKAFILTAGLMNLLLMLDVWDISRGKKG